MKTMSKSAKKFFAAAACMGMLLVCFAGCNQLNGGGGRPNSKTLIILATRKSLPKNSC